MRRDLVLLGRLLALARPQWRRMALAGFLAAGTCLAGLGLMAVAGWFLAAMAIAGATTGMINYFLPSAGIRLLAILRTGGRYLERLTSHDAVFRLLASLRLMVFRRLEPLSPGQLQDRRGADLAGSLTADIDSLQHAFLRMILPLAVALLCSIVTVAGLLLVHPPTAIAVAALLLAAGGVVPAIARRVASAPGAEIVEHRAALRVATADLIQGAVDLHAAGATGRQVERIEVLSQALASAQQRAALPGAAAEAFVGLAAGLALLAAAFLASGSVLAGQLAPALAPSLALVALASFEAIAPLPGAMQKWGEVMAAARRLFALIDQTPDFTEPAEAIPVPANSSLIFQDVRLRYADDGIAALDGFDLAVPSGRRVAILGPSGAGKSTIGWLLLRFCDYEGRILLGDHDLRRYRGEDLRRTVGMAAQDAPLLNLTLRENLLMAAPDADEAAMMQALSDAELGPFVASLPRGLDTPLGEGGAQVSAGEARRLVIARTLLRDPAILVLDEPTENLDPTTTRRLLASLDRVTKSKTTLLITHDASLAREFADLTVVMERGRVVATRLGS